MKHVKLLFVIIYALMGGNAFAQGADRCYEMCRVHSLPEDQCIRQRCRRIPAGPKSGDKLECKLGNGPFKMQLTFGRKIDDRSWSSMSFELSGYSPSGPRRIGYEFDSIASVSNYSTRVGTGFSIKSDIHQLGVLSLKWVQWTSDARIEPLGITGSLTLPNGRSNALTCKLK